MSALPSSAYARCASCGEPVKPSPLVLHEVVGYTRPRSDGGANHIIARRETGRLVCADCSLSVQRGDDPAQGSLL